MTASSARRTYVLDTSVLLADPSALTRFAEHEIVIPLIVVTELEAKRTHPELGFFAREALRQLDEMRIEHGRLDLPMKVNDEGGELSVDMSQIDASLLPSAFSLDNDGKILATAKLLSTQGADVYVVSKDLPMRVKASALGLSAQEYRAEFVASSGWTGTAGRRGRAPCPAPAAAPVPVAGRGCDAARSPTAGAGRHGAPRPTPGARHSRRAPRAGARPRCARSASPDP